MAESWAWFLDQLNQTFIVDDRWKYFVDGVLTTLQVTIFALLLGVVIGVVIAVIRSAHDSQRRKQKGLGHFILGFFDWICKIYLTVIRGTPSTVQLLIMWFIIFQWAREDMMVWVASISFGINSGAYVAEIVRSGIMSIDQGQSEAGRSLGLNYTQTMSFIVIPQAVKNILPALGNELITLLKETSVCSLIGLQDLTKGAMIVQSRTYAPYIPYISIAVIYLAMVLILTGLLTLLERRLRASDRR
jgi:ABC-type amino acid transport system permease subunit